MADATQSRASAKISRFHLSLRGLQPITDDGFLFDVEPLALVPFLTSTASSEGLAYKWCLAQADLARSLKVESKFIISVDFCLSIELLAMT